MLLTELFRGLFEAKEDWIAQNMGRQLLDSARREHEDITDVNQLINRLKVADPNGKYLVFIAKMYAAKQFRLEDIGRIHATLADFNRVKGQLENKDIMTYSKISAVTAAITPFLNKDAPVSKKEEKRTVKNTESKSIIDTPNFKVLQPLTEAAAKLYGANTQWCTAADKDNRFDFYNKQGPIYIIIAGHKKFQLHFESDQFMDETDEEIGRDDITYLSKFGEYKNFLNMLIHKHYEV